ncbi:MAG: hypothetical protein RRX92_06420 [Lachnospiraceae bacterium]
MQAYKPIKSMLLLLAALLLYGCGKEDTSKQDTSKQDAPKQDASKQETAIEYMPIAYTGKASKGYEVKTVDYDFGSYMLQQAGETDTPYQLRGILSYPINHSIDKLRTVVLIHGCHDNYNERRYDVGFRYLTEYLAENGYLAVSIDVNAAYDWHYGDNREYTKVPLLFAKQMQLLDMLNEGKENPYGIDLENRIAMDSIMLLGHSTAGEIIFDIAREQENHVDYLVSLAPTGNALDTEYDIPLKGLSILVPEYDGDVMNLDGIAIWNRLKHSEKQQRASAVLLKKANHNYFNTVLTVNDAERTGQDITGQLTKEQQRDFLKNYVVMNADIFFGGVYTDTIFDPHVETTDKINGLDVVTYLKTQGLVVLADEETAYQGNGQVLISREIDSTKLPQDTTPGIATALLGEDSLRVTRFLWHTKNAFVTIPLSRSDWRDFGSLGITVMPDPYNEANKKGEAQGFTLVLEDRLGHRAGVVITQDSQLIAYPRGEMATLDLEEQGMIYFWDGVTVPVDIRIPLSYFDTLDLKNISKCSILLNQKEEGCFYLQSIELLK